MRPNKQLGLQLYNNSPLQQHYAMLYGQQYVNECLDLAITTLDPQVKKQYRTAQVKKVNGTKKGRYK